MFLIEGGHGGYNYEDDYYTNDHSCDTILSFDVTNQIWKVVGHMIVNRYAHAVSVVNALYISQRRQSLGARAWDAQQSNFSVLQVMMYDQCHQ